MKIKMKRLFLLCLVSSLVGCGSGRSNGPWVDSDHVDEIRVSLVGSGGGAGGGGGGSEPTQQPTGWATLRGKFVLDGPAPQRQALKVDKETDVCAPGGKQVLSENMVVASDGGIKDVVIYLTSKISPDEPWTHPSMKPGVLTDKVDFDQKDCIFLTHVLAMRTGQTLNILNSDSVGHNTNLSAKKNPGFNQIIPSGTAGISYTPTSEENAPFAAACSIHPWMGANILVRDNGYFAVTAPDGTFEIPNLPAGVDLEFRVWQEKTNFVQKVSVDGQSQKWSKGKFVKSLTAGENQLQVTVSL